MTSLMIDLSSFSLPHFSHHWKLNESKVRVHKSSQWISRSLKKAILLEFLNCKSRSKFSSRTKPKTFRKFCFTNMFRDQCYWGRGKRKNWLSSNSKPSQMPVISDWKATKEYSGPIHLIRAKCLGSDYSLRNDLAFTTFFTKEHFIRNRQPECSLHYSIMHSWSYCKRGPIYFY